MAKAPAAPSAEEIAAQLAAESAPAEAAALPRYRVKSNRFFGHDVGDEVALDYVTPEQLQHLEPL